MASVRRALNGSRDTPSTPGPRGLDDPAAGLPGNAAAGPSQDPAAAPHAAAVPSDPARVPRDPAAAPAIAGLRILDAIGSGPRGTVYRATDGTRTLAVKVFRRGAPPDHAVLDLFLPRNRAPEAARAPHDTARALAAPGAGDPRIRHPALAPIEAIGETADGLRYATMPLLRGDPLERIIADLKRGACDRPSLSPLAIEADGSVHPRFTTSAVETFAEVAEGLAAAHARAVRHRRLTPRNLIFTPAGRLLVTDFGGDAATAGDGLAYRAPEELGPFPERAGPEADVYALGVILYEVLTRRSPFTAASPAELKRAIVKGRFPVPRSFRAEVPAALEAIVLKAMARRPEDRYRNAGELAADLRRFLRHETPLAIREARLSSRPGDRGERGDDRCEVPAAGDSPAPPTAARSRFRSLAGSGGARRRAATAAALVLSLATAAWWVSSHVLGPAREADPVLSFNPGSAGAPRAAGRAPATSSPAREEAALIRRPEPAATPPAANPLGIQSSFIDGLLAVSGTGTPALTGAAFAALVDETERVSARDPAAVQALCRWDLELVAALDLAPRPASVMVPPGMRVELEAGDPGDFTARWVRTRSRIDPGALGTPELLAAFAGGALPASFDDLDEEEALDRRTSVLRELLAGLVRAGGAGARQAAAVIARDHYLTNGKDALSALVALAAHEELAALARGSLPLPLREAALVLVGERFAGLAAGELRSIAVASPEASLRRAAFHALAELADANAVALLPRLLDDPDLRGEASAVLAAFPAGALGPIALDLLDHGDGAVRSRGVDAAAASGEELVRPLALRLLSPRWAVREAAFAALARRGDLPRVAEALSVVLGRPGPPPHPSPLPPPDAGALARAADAPGG